MRGRVSNSVVAASVLLLSLILAGPAEGQVASYYVLDGFGGVHAGGGAPAVPGTPYFGFDIAKGIAYAPGASGNGIMVLDGFGGVHRVGLGPAVGPTPYFGFNIARAITYRNVPPRIASDATNALLDIDATSATYTVIRSLTITAPDDGFLLVIGSSYLGCASAVVTDTLAGELTINVDATTEPGAITDMAIATFPDCRPGEAFFQTNNQTLAHVFPVGAGAHTVNLLVRKSGGTATAELRVLGRSLTALFIDHNGMGSS
jgi:hypothetical protein